VVARLSARGLVFEYPGPLRALDGVDLEIREGELTVVIGPNGSGKSTLLRLLLGLLAPESGVVAFRGRSPLEWPRRALAREVGVVTQHEELAFPVTVRELVAMGRYPHTGPWRAESGADRAAIDRALVRCEVAELAERPIATLSGGERQRARLARALAAEPATLVLDEPTASLDIAHEMAMFELLRGLANHDGVTVLLVTHALNLAARYADRLTLLDRGRVVASGEADGVLVRETIERVYRWPVAILRHPGPGADTGTPQIVPLAHPPRGVES
jgi:iron complex transport system ATP-binding protein